MNDYFAHRDHWPILGGGFYEAVGLSVPYWTAAVLAGLAAVAITVWCAAPRLNWLR
jgi:hypothetical protein